MHIHSIFTEIPDRLWAVAFTDTKKNAIDELQENWSDVLWLESFFEANKSDLLRPFYDNISIEDAIIITQDEGDELIKKIRKIDGNKLDSMFLPLDDRSISITDFEKLKAKGSEQKSWLRIYAVKYLDGYIITGGAIKLTHQMEGREHTQRELQKLDRVRDGLKLGELDDLFVYLDI